MIALLILAGVGLVLVLAYGRGHGLVSVSTYIRWSWLPVAALGLQAAFVRPLMNALSYFFIVPMLLTCFASLALGGVGLLLLRRSSHDASRVPLAVATVAASLPGVLLLGYILFALARGLAGARA